MIRRRSRTRQQGQGAPIHCATKRNTRRGRRRVAVVCICTSTSTSTRVSTSTSTSGSTSRCQTRTCGHGHLDTSHVCLRLCALLVGAPPNTFEVWGRTPKRETQHPPIPAVFPSLNTNHGEQPDEARGVAHRGRATRNSLQRLIHVVIQYSKFLHIKNYTKFTWRRTK